MLFQVEAILVLIAVTALNAECLVSSIFFPAEREPPVGVERLGRLVTLLGGQGLPGAQPGED